MKTLLKTEAEVIQFSGASTSLSIKRLTPYLTHSRSEKEIRRILTDTLFDELVAMYDDATINDAGNAHMLALLPYVQKPLLLLSIYDYLGEGHAQVNDAGVMVANRDKTAYAWQVEKLLTSYIEKAYFCLDELIKYLNKNKEDFEAWATSSAYSLSREFFINTPDEFQQFVNIRESYRMLVVLKPSMRQIESGRIKNTVGKVLFDDLKDGILKDDLTADELELMPMLLPAVAFLTMADSIENLNVELTADGGYVQSLAKNETTNIERKAADDVKLRSYYDKLKQKGDGWLTELADYLNTNASPTKFAGYFSSDNYEDPEVQAEISDTTLKTFNGMTGA